jgi:nitroreductase
LHPAPNSVFLNSEGTINSLSSTTTNGSTNKTSIFHYTTAGCIRNQLIMNNKIASTDHPINELLANRWSPYGFDSRPVTQADLCSLFEAARWAPSSYNEQPWSFLVATRENPGEFERLLSCLVEGNQAWAKNAPVLALGVVSLKFARNKEDNRAAVHDLGLAAGNLLVEATARGLRAHQMIGILPDKAREVYQIPEHSTAWTAIAIGYNADPAKLPDALKERDLKPRQRKPLSEFVFTGKWGQSSPVVLKGAA